MTPPKRTVLRQLRLSLSLRVAMTRWCFNREMYSQPNSWFIKTPVHIFVLFFPVAFVGNIGFVAFFLNLCAQFV